MQTTNASPMLGRLAFLGACAATVLAPLHALARFATHDGAGDLRSPLVHWWAAPAARTFRILLDWGSPDTVYLTYGKAWLPIIVAATACAFAVRRARRPVGLELWGWRIALTGYVLGTLSEVGEYWTPWIDETFLVVGLPGTLVCLVGSTLLGIALLRHGFRPRATGWLLATWLVTLFALSSVIALGAALLPMLWAWGLAGRRMAASVPENDAVPVA